MRHPGGLRAGCGRTRPCQWPQRGRQGLFNAEEARAFAWKSFLSEVPRHLVWFLLPQGGLQPRLPLPGPWPALPWRPKIHEDMYK